MKKEHVLAFLAAWGGWVIDAFDFTIFLVAMPDIAREFGVSATTTALTISLSLLTRLLGGIFSGWMADHFGRRLPLMLSLVWLALCDAGVAFAPSFAWVIALRALFGLGMGAEFAAGATLAMEKWPARTRGIASGVLQGSWALGFLLAGYARAWIAEPYGIRALFLVPLALALVVIPIRLFVPDSRPEPKPDVKWPVAPLLWASLILGAAFIGYYALSAFLPLVLINQLRLSAPDVAHHIALFNVGMFVGAIMCGAIAMKSLRLAFILPALLLLPCLPLVVGHWPELTLLGAFFGGMFGGGTSGVTPLLLTSIFPAHIRARGVGLVYHLGAVIGALAPPLTAWIATQPEMGHAHAIIVVAAAAQILLITLVLAGRNLFRAARADALRVDAV